ncbi:MAG: CoA transferase [Mycolicibacterium insubricum]|nr:CoA transferase [Mycobacterium sp.]
MSGVDDAVTAWAASGLAALTGPTDGPPDFSRAPILAAATDLAPDAATLLTGRAGLLGLRRRGRISAGGATRLLATLDGWVALTLSRPDDIAAVPALLAADAVDADPWPEVTAWAAGHRTGEIVARAVLLDLPAAALGETTAAPPRIRQCGRRGTPRAVAGLLVADLTSMWAGPLCARRLADAGATVVKVESPRRPDGTRAGDPRFFDWMNAGKISCTVDFDTDADRLWALLTVADVVLEGSRPAALARRGLGPEDIPGPPGRVWLRITGHGDGPGEGRVAFGDGAARVAFGDDAAVAGGLVGRAPDGSPVFCGDAIADPLTGLAAAAAVSEALTRGGGELIEISMAAVAAEYAAQPSLPQGYPPNPPVAADPTAPPPAAAASALGADNAAVDALVAARSTRC